ncbi:helix-turn-helix domain-containing protein [Streptomyces solincola]|uniref:helix-turn-helix domain-containing protein n=1 Tax=Streptomyces solincola TaxID=2100817 RepID=UPI0011B22442|nr:helix-turn-helix transcriptional regulator [Streptomyces solincola]
MAQRARSSPTLEHLVVARQLQRAREEYGRLSFAEAAERAGTSHMSIRRLESAATALNPDLIRRLLRLYGVPAAESRGLMERVEAARRPGWWHERYRTVMSAAYQEWIALESAAFAIRLWQPALVPDLLRTPAYTAALHRAEHPRADRREVDLVVELAAERQRRLAQRSARLWVLMGAAALHTSVGTPGVRRGQHAALEEALSRRRVNVQLLPLDAGPHPLLACGPVRLLRLDAGEVADHVVAESPMATTITGDGTAVARLRRALDATAALAAFPRTLVPYLPDVPDTPQETEHG